LFTPPFYKTYWFYVLIGVLSSILIIIFLKKRLESIVQQKEVSKSIEVLKNKALQAQMNPHFIFNAMNAIQGLISVGDNLNSERYLSKFSKLLRASLQDSRELCIPLSKEIENLKTYLDLEILRFEDQLSYQIIMDEELEIDLIKIPPMLIQPFIENCFIHGFSNIAAKGEVKISFEENELDQIICKVEDNGIGRQIKESTCKIHVSLGTKIVKERLMSLGKITPEEAIVYHDLKDKKGNAIGTRVLITIPII